ncbi:MAG: hypothetical protein LBQ81_02580 [Zoogloeaceae bacterium]|jgi:hypothetical protein|nr:hypothetical protein [Zoogloeaceae bacterium]
MVTPTPDNLLTGNGLEALMNRLEADFEEGSAEEIHLLERLRERPLRADSLEAIGRLHTLWVWAGDKAAALAVIENDGALLVQAAPPDEQADIAMRLRIFRLQVARYFDDEADIQATLDAIIALAAQPGLHAGDFADTRLLAQLRVESSSLDIALKAAEAKNALIRAIPERAALRGWDTCVHQANLAVAYRWHGKPEEAKTAGAASLAALDAAATNGENIEDSDWLWAGNALIDILPERLPLFRARITALTQENALPQRRETEVRLARLAARALYAQGDLSGALAACDDARYSLAPYGNGGDDFIEYELPWLMEAGRVEDAGRRAFFQLYEAETLENGVWAGVYRLILERLSDPAETSFWWPLCAMRACNYAHTLADLLSFAPEEPAPELKAIFGEFLEQDIDREGDNAAFEPIFQAAQTLAEIRAPEHPWIRRLAVVRDFYAECINAHVYLEQLEAAAHDGKMADWRTANGLFEARMFAHGVMKALTNPPPMIFHLESGRDCYAFAGGLVDQVETAIEALPEAEQDEAWRLCRQIRLSVYEHGKARMEHYFETGKGHPRDAAPHLYSMLCNNLAILYRSVDKNMEALETHRRGIAASSFAEHYDGILWNYHDLDDKAKIVEAAETLWQYAETYGYSRHDPANYIPRVAAALWELGRQNPERHNEIPIWMERLVTWERENEIDEANLPPDSLSARLSIGFHLAHAHRDQALALWNRLRTQFENSTVAGVVGDAADLARGLDMNEEAITLYERRLLLEDNQVTREFLQKFRAEVEAEAKANAKSWWQIWK